MRKVAFLVGNSSYQSISKLDTPRNDVNIMYRSLRLYGFTTFIFYNLDSYKLFEVINNYMKLCDRDGVCLFYFSGHGVNVDAGNYILPVDSDIESVKYYSANVELLVGSESVAKRVVILDACRSSIERLITKDNMSAGYSEQKIASNCLLSFSTSLGKVAKDSLGGSDTSPYSLFLSNNLKKYGKFLTTIASRTRTETFNKTLQEQLPTDISTLQSPIVFAQRFSEYEIKTIRYFLEFSYGLASDPASNVFVYNTSTKLEFFNGAGKFEIPLNGVFVERIRLAASSFLVCCTDGSVWYVDSTSQLCVDLVLTNSIWDIASDQCTKKFFLCGAQGVFEFNLTNKSLRQFAVAESYSLFYLGKVDSLFFFSSNASRELVLAERNCYSEKTYYHKVIDERGNAISGFGYDIAYSSRYEVIISATSKGVMFFNIKTNKLTLKAAVGERYPGFIDSIDLSCDRVQLQNEYFRVAVHPNEKEVATGTRDGKIHIWDIENQTIISELLIDTQHAEISNIAWLTDDSMLVTLNSKKLIAVIKSGSSTANIRFLWEHD